MAEVFNDPVQFSKGINLNDLMTTASEFHIDVDFKKKKQMESILDDSHLSESDDDSDDEDVFKNLEASTEKLLLSSPGRHSFSDMAAKMIDCVPNGAVKMMIIDEGEGPLVPYDAEVTIHYAAYWENATIPFDSTITMNYGNPIQSRLGAKRLLPGLEVGLTMVKGPKARFHLLLEPSATWGPKGILRRVRPEKALFVIVLYDVRDVAAADRFNDLPREEQKKFEVTIQTVTSLHKEAKNLFAKKGYQKAIKNYQQSMSILTMSQPKSDAESMELKQLKIKTYVNLAVCYYKLNKPKYVIAMCENLDSIIDIETHCKALFYYGRAYEMQGKNDEALNYYKKALKLEPKNKEIGETLAKLDEYIKKSAKKEKEIWQNAFKLSPKEKEIVYNEVDEELKKCIFDMCQDLAASDEYAKFDLPKGLLSNEMDYIKNMIKDFKGLYLHEEKETHNNKAYIVKKLV